MRYLIGLFILLLLTSCSSSNSSEPNDGSTPLFNGKDLTNWKKTNFGGDGEISVKDGEIFMDYGNPMTGITWTGKELPKVNYEVTLEAQKVDGNDFFVGLTVPYHDSHMTLVLGGWGGVTCGISSFNYADASENDTTFVKMFHKKKWYKVKFQVTETRVRAFVDGEQLIDFLLDGMKVHTRPEVDPSKPFGLCAFETQVKYRNIRIKEIDDIPEEDL